MAHTPGPWRFNREKCAIESETAFEDWSLDPVLFDEPYPKAVFTLYGACGGDDSAADIALAAAAPELLEQLIAARAECEAWRKGLNHRTNINKAKVGATYADQLRIAAAILKATLSQQ